jgi:antitoxin CcdA
MLPAYDVRATKRPVNLSLNEDLVREVRKITPNLSERVEALLAEYLESERARRSEADRALDAALVAWNEFEDRVGSLADEHSTL